MKKVMSSKPVWAAALLFTLASCNKNNDAGIVKSNDQGAVTSDMIAEQGNNPDEATVGQGVGILANRSAATEQQYLYTESNEAGNNAIIIYQVKQGGALESKGTVASGGVGTGKGLGSQGALAVSENHQWLFAVNAGDNSVSSFKVQDNGQLTLTSTEHTKGIMPVSVTVHDNLLYVLNRGSDNINGFHVSDDGKLTYIEGSTQPLSSQAVDAPQVSITPDGAWVLVTEKATNIVGTFKIKADGSIAAGKFNSSAGPTPFGFDFARGFMIVSNAAGGAAGAGSATSNVIENDGSVKAVNGAVANQQGAPCWVATTKYGRFAFVSNTGSNSVSSYYVASWGAIFLIDAAAGTTDMSPADIVVAPDNYNVYLLTSRAHTINGFHRKPLGGLESTVKSSVLPASTSGLAIL
jgi:6-phosphogluconolactonase (cycloisomerase 2 family)